MKKLVGILSVLVLSGCEPKPAPERREALVVPPLPDFSTIDDVQEKKQAFFDYMLPLIHEANARIMAERMLVEKWHLDADSLSSDEQAELQHLLTKYRVTSDDPDEQKDLLLRRVNTIPPSLVLAQAANESAWGTSRFAREGNNLFGQWCFSRGCGLVPEDRNDGSRHEVRAFDTPLDSITSYMRNLNSHPQYRDLRELRLQDIEQQGHPGGISLAEGLQGYSERGDEYVDEIQQMIRFNRLQRFDETPQGSDNPPESEPSSGE